MLLHILQEVNRQKELERQADEDSRLAWKLHCEEQMLQVSVLYYSVVTIDGKGRDVWLRLDASYKCSML